MRPQSGSSRKVRCRLSSTSVEGLKQAPKKVSPLMSSTTTTSSVASKSCPTSTHVAITDWKRQSSTLVPTLPTSVALEKFYHLRRGPRIHIPRRCLKSWLTIAVPVQWKQGYPKILWMKMTLLFFFFFEAASLKPHDLILLLTLLELWCCNIRLSAIEHGSECRKW